MDLYRVYGNPIAQSKSPDIHTAFAKQTNQKIEYKKELVAIGEFEQAVNRFIKQGGKGANVTAPFKENAMNMCHQLTERARLAGAVNTLSFRNGMISGDNTDGVGLVNDLLRNGAELSGADILLLGAGGAAKGVILPLLKNNPKSITLANRTIAKAEIVVSKFEHPSLRAIGFEETASGKYDIIINATSAGLTGSTLPISDETIAKSSICYDMVYAKELTAFLTQAKKLNVEKVIDGLGMLVGQAAESFSIWRSVTPNVGPVLNVLREQLNKS